MFRTSEHGRCQSLFCSDLTVCGGGMLHRSVMLLLLRAQSLTWGQGLGIGREMAELGGVAFQGWLGRWRTDGWVFRKRQLNLLSTLLPLVMEIKGHWAWERILSLYILDNFLSLVQGSSTWFNWLASELQGSSCLCLHSTGVIETQHKIWLCFRVVLGTELRSSFLGSMSYLSSP